jgi:hypothetical protein
MTTARAGLDACARRSFAASSIEARRWSGFSIVAAVFSLGHSGRQLPDDDTSSIGTLSLSTKLHVRSRTQVFGERVSCVVLS